MERLGLDFFRGDLPMRAGLSPQQLVAVGVVVVLGVSGVRDRWPAPAAETAAVRGVNVYLLGATSIP